MNKKYVFYGEKRVVDSVICISFQEKDKIFQNKRAQRALGRSPEEKVKR